jgi:hypothetical protein
LRDIADNADENLPIIQDHWFMDAEVAAAKERKHRKIEAIPNIHISVV